MTNKQTEEVIREFRKQFHDWFLDCYNENLDGDSEKELEAFILTAIKEAEERGRKEAFEKSRRTLVQIAITYRNANQEAKGLIMYSKMLKYLKSKLK